MMWLRTLAVVGSLTLVVHGAILSFLQTPRHDGVKRVCHLGAENFTLMVGAADVAVIIVKDQQQSASQCPSEMDTFAEVTAQVLRKRSSIVCQTTIDVFQNYLNTGQAGFSATDGDVFVFKAGRGTPYYGKRSTRALLNYLFKVNGTEVNVISGKIDKVAYDAVEQVKLVGFFMQGTADYQAFEAAASVLSPSVAFYAVFDRMVAKHLKLSIVGEINLVKPFSKTPVKCPQNPATAADIEAFVKLNQGSLLTKITEHNIYDPTLLSESKLVVLAIAEESSPAGGYFYRLVTRLARNSTNSTEFEQLNIVWVEPHAFPQIHLVMDELETTLGIPNQLPAFGSLNVTTLKSSWLNASLLNFTSDKTSDAQNLVVLREFLNGVVNNTLVPVKIGAQSFVQTPASRTAAEGSPVELECVVSNPAGDCLWTRDGRGVGYSLDRHPHYRWRGDRASGDCSLVIVSAKAGRDGGRWTCEVTGTGDDDPPLVSQPAELLVVPAAAASESVKAEL